ncbi:MAG: hypothetical protein WC869_00905 [Phycisphaerae bacterium]|jgi:hypothetical protein
MQPKVASLVLDLYDDEKGAVARSFPSELHACKVAALETVQGLSNRDFALVMKTASGLQRRYPIHDLDNLKISRAYFDQAKAFLPAEAVAAAEAKFASRERLLAAGEGELSAEDFLEFNKIAYVDITSTLPTSKKAFAEKSWGLTVGGKNYYPLHDAELVKMAIARFPFTTINLEPVQKFAYARNIAKRASALDVVLPDSSQVNLYTGNDVNPTSLRIALDQRKEAARKADIGTEVLDQLADAAGLHQEDGSMESLASVNFRAAKLAGRNAVNADWIITTLAVFDKTAGIGAVEYRKGLLDPFAACFKAAGFSGSMLIDGVDLSRIDPSKLAEHFDEEFLREFSENPIGVYQALPSPVKQAVRDMAMDGMGSSASLGFNPKPEASSVTSAGDPTEMLAYTYSNGRAVEY